jgi:hypothetical protein
MRIRVFASVAGRQDHSPLMTGDPVLIAYSARRARNGRRVHYERIGHAFPHAAGEGLTVILDAMPLKGGHIVLLELDESDDRQLLAKARPPAHPKAELSDETGPERRRGRLRLNLCPRYCRASVRAGAATHIAGRARTAHAFHDKICRATCIHDKNGCKMSRFKRMCRENR